jgi:hypothetical protein
MLAKSPMNVPGVAFNCDRRPETVAYFAPTGLYGVRRCKLTDRRPCVLGSGRAPVSLPGGPDCQFTTVRESFYTHKPAEGTPAQKGEFRRKRFNRAVDWAEDQQLIAIMEIDGVTYLRLTRPEQEEEQGQGQD